MGTAASSQESLEQHQAAYDKANQDLSAPYLIPEKPAALLVANAQRVRGELDATD